MGFYLWVDEESAWAQGTYEYRPMGAAVIARERLDQRRRLAPGAGVEDEGGLVFDAHGRSVRR